MPILNVHSQYCASIIDIFKETQRQKHVQRACSKIFRNLSIFLKEIHKFQEEKLDLNQEMWRIRHNKIIHQDVRIF